MPITTFGREAVRVGDVEELAEFSGVPVVVGVRGLSQQLTKRVLESTLEGETTDHAGYEEHDPAGKNSGNSRSGSRGKTVLTDVGPVEVKVSTRCGRYLRAADHPQAAEPADRSG